MHYWTEGGLPNNDDRLARVAKMTLAEWQAARPTIKAFFQDGWRHKRVDRELAEVEMFSERGEIAGLASAAAKKASKSTRRQQDFNKTPTRLQQDANETATKLQPSPSPSPSPSSSLLPSPKKGKNSDVSTSAAAAAAAPVYSDSRHELWGEGVAILGQLGIPEKPARSNIGRWLKSNGDDCPSLLAAILRAREQKIIDPIPWITRALATTGPPRGRPKSMAELALELDRKIHERD
jgi:uncharacterized protein YdaU (DUF1376 family)